MNDTIFGAWLGLSCAVLWVGVSVWRNRRLATEQVGLAVAVALAGQNILPPLKFVLFALTANHPPLPPPITGLEKYLLVAGVASEMVTLVSLYSLFLQALKVIPKS